MAVNLICSWAANPPGESITGYKVYLDSALSGSPSGTTFTINNVAAGSHSVEVSAVNALGEGPKSVAFPVTVPNFPTQVQSVSVTINYVV